MGWTRIRAAMEIKYRSSQVVNFHTNYKISLCILAITTTMMKMTDISDFKTVLSAEGFEQIVSCLGKRSGINHRKCPVPTPFLDKSDKIMLFYLAEFKSM